MKKLFQPGLLSGVWSKSPSRESNWNPAPRWFHRVLSGDELKGNNLRECPWDSSMDALNFRSDFWNHMNVAHISMEEELTLFLTRRSLFQMAINAPEIDW